MAEQEFHLSITPLGEDRYWIRTEDVAPGVPLAEFQTTWPVEDWLKQSNQWHYDPLMSLLTPMGGVPATQDLMGLGQTLYESLFQGRVRDSWLAAQGIAQNRKQRLRLRLGFKDSRLQRLPWELLYGDDRPLATGTDITFARFFCDSALADPGPLPIGHPLRVLVVVSAPDDQERLALSHEVRQLQQELSQSSPADGPPGASSLAIELKILEQPDRAELVSALEQESFQVLHYAGHSEVSETGGDLYLVNPHTGLSDRLSGEDLAGLLVNNGIRLAVFNSCRGAYTQADDAETGWREQNLVQSLLNRGVPGVIAMAERIPDNVAITFTQLLYRNLRREVSIDLSLSRTRQGLISAFGSDQVYWMLPIVYLHPNFNGYFYDNQQADRADPWLAEDLREGDLILVNNEPLKPTAFSQDDLQAEDEELRELLAVAGDPSYDEDAEVVTDLLKQLSGSPPPETPLKAPQDEDLSPDWKNDRPPLQETLPEPRPFLKPPDSPAEPAAAATAKSPLPGLSRPLLIVGGVGIAAIIAAVVLTITTRPLTPPLQPRASTPTAPASDSPVFVEALAALKQGETEAASALMEQLLDQGTLQQAESLIQQISADQLQNDPALNYTIGRWHWQRQLQSDDSSARDAERAWQRAVQNRSGFLEALVALGFAHYELGEFEAAIRTWQQAIRIDQRQLRDRNPEIIQVANGMTVNAYAGLAMVYFQQSQAPNNSDADTQRLRQQAQASFNDALTLEPGLLSTFTLDWLWVPVASDFQDTIDSLPTTPN